MPIEYWDISHLYTNMNISYTIKTVRPYQVYEHHYTQKYSKTIHPNRPIQFQLLVLIYIKQQDSQSKHHQKCEGSQPQNPNYHIF